MCGARLQGDVESGPARIGAGRKSVEGFDLGVESACTAVPAAGEDLSFLDNDRPNGRVGTCASDALFGFEQGDAKIFFVFRAGDARG